MSRADGRAPEAAITGGEGLRDVLTERARIVILAALGPLLAWAQLEDMVWSVMVPVWWVMGIGGLLYSRVAVFNDREMARRVTNDSALYVFGEAFLGFVVTLFVGTAVAGTKAPTAAVFVAAGVVALAVVALNRALASRASQRGAVPPDGFEQRLQRVERATVGVETAVLAAVFTYLEGLRHDVVFVRAVANPIFDTLFYAVLLLGVLGPVYLVLVRFRTRIVEADLSVELAVALSGYLAFMLTPPPP